jgi:hypothetical protein
VQPEESCHIPNRPEDGDIFDTAAYFFRIIVQKSDYLAENPLGFDFLCQVLPGKSCSDNVEPA